MYTQWNGKKWYCYGTSMTDNSRNTGWYSGPLAELAGLEEHNFGKGNSGIIPALHKEDNVKSRVMRLDDGKAEADLITVEVIPNDMRGELGCVTDLGDDTFCGNLNQVLQYLLENTRATVVVLIATRARYQPGHPENAYTPVSASGQNRLKWEKTTETVCRMHGVPCWNAAAEAGLGYYRVAGDNSFVADQIHLTPEGGRRLALYYWSRLRQLLPPEK